ncbi:MAG TPA: hypothetical protein V6D46_06835 [Coleofasciculaceae cyanobacterium]
MNSNLDSVPSALQAQLLGQFLDMETGLDSGPEADGLLDLDPVDVDRAIEQALTANAFDPLDTLEVDFGIDPASERSLSSSDLSVANPMLELDAMPVVDQRYHALLKQRLMLEATQRPPLFPWESPGMELEYLDTYEDAPAIARVPSNPWLRQLQALNLPTTLPTEVADRLLAACQAIATQALKEGVALMRAVDDLFPGQDRMLNTQAGVVLRWATASRSSGAASPASRFPMDYVEYDNADPKQQMTLAMAAARELLERLTLNLSASQRLTNREWLADGGALRIEARYSPAAEQSSIDLTLRLPGMGTATLSGPRASVQATGEGMLRLSMLDVQPGDRYSLAVTQIGETELPPLTFTVLVS